MARYGLREVANVVLYDYSTQAPYVFMDTLKMSDLTVAAKSVDAVGGQGANRLLTWDYGRTATLDVQDALMNPASMSALTGKAEQVGVQNVRRRQVVTAVAGTGGTGIQFTLDRTPIAGSIMAFATTDGYTQGDLLDMTSATITSMTVALSTGTVGQYIVYFQYAAGANTSLIEITADDFPGFYTVWGETFVRNDDTGEDEPYHIVIAKAKLTPGFKLSLEAESNTPTVFDFKLEAYKPSDDDVMVQFIKIDDSEYNS